MYSVRVCISLYVLDFVFCDNRMITIVCCYVVVVVFTLKTVLTSIQYLLFLTLQGKETNFRANPAVNTPRPSRGTRIESCDFVVLIGDP